MGECARRSMGKILVADTQYPAFLITAVYGMFVFRSVRPTDTVAVGGRETQRQVCENAHFSETERLAYSLNFLV